MSGLNVYSPDKLYNLCLDAVKNGFILQSTPSSSTIYWSQTDFLYLPDKVLLDFYGNIFLDRKYYLLSAEFSCLEIFNKLLHVKGKRYLLLSYYEMILEHNEVLTKTLLRTFTKYISVKKSHFENFEIDLIDLGMELGSFYNEGGWYNDSIKFLEKIEEILLIHRENKVILLKLLECYKMKLHAESQYCNFIKADETYKSISGIIESLKCNNQTLASIFSTISAYYYIKGNFDESYSWAFKALELLPSGLSKRNILEILSQACKVCVVKRKFNQAGLLIKQALELSKTIEDYENQPLYSEILMDYGNYLLNSDSARESVAIYMDALENRLKIFTQNNIHIALAHEDLAFSLYVSEYNTGNFWKAKEHAENSIQIMEKILPNNHLLLASAKRVKALILEEIALDERSNEDTKQELLATAEELHKTVLDLTIKSFGEKNIQTAKHYGNLGRLYQSMDKYEKAEEMHLRAIKLKEDLFGPNDYEVGVSLGHLASLYNYHIKNYQQAEELYLRSIEINIRLFGIIYSGLGYDYRGLIHTSSKTNEPSKYVFYTQKHRDWKKMRNNLIVLHKPEELLLPQNVVQKFLEIGEEQKKLEEDRSLLAEEFKWKNQNE